MMSNKLFETQIEPELPEGVTVLRGFISATEQISFVEECRQIAGHSPLVRPRMPSGYELSLSITGVGDAVWFSDEVRGYHYAKRHPKSGKPWGKIPRAFLNVARRAAEEVGLLRFKPDTCLINYYPKNTGKLGLHVDNTEEDLTSPIVTVSLGETCRFLIGGLQRSDKKQKITLYSGDCLVMHRAGRMFYHGVEKLIPDSSDLLKGGGRISLTLRRNKPAKRF